MTKARLVQTIEMERVISDMVSQEIITEEFGDEIVESLPEIEVHWTFEFSEYRPAVLYPNDKACAEEPIEIEFQESCSAQAFEIMHQIVKEISIGTVLHVGEELIKLKQGIEDYLQRYIEGEGEEMAYQAASEYKQDRLCAEADHKLDQMKDERIEDKWEE